MNSKPDCMACNISFAKEENMLHQLAESLGSAIDAKDSYTSLHSEEVAEISFNIALSLGLSERESEIIHVAGHLHDIGKIGIPDSILQKEGPLNESEWSEIKKHPDTGASILKPVDCLVQNGIVEMVRGHHERFDGKGYPNGLKGEDIAIGARIIALSDTISALHKDRPYRKAVEYDEIIKEIKNCSGSQFDPKVVEAFINIKDVVFSFISRLHGVI